MRMIDRVRYYDGFDDDFFETRDQQYSLPADYRYIRSPFLSSLVYTLAFLFALLYCPLRLHLRVKGAAKLRRQTGGFLLYGNHTQPIGDVVDPALACFPKRIFTVVSPANFGIPVIGRLLPYLGALPLADSVGGMKAFTRAMETRLRQGHPVMLYPEAHLWEYYTGIRPFSDAAFKYPVKFDVPVYSVTSTYQKRRFGKRPRLTLYVDGPFDRGTGTPKQQAATLRDAVFTRMTERSQLSNCQYVCYKERKSSNESP